MPHSWPHLPPHLLPWAPNQCCSTLLICQLHIRCSPQQQQQHPAAATAGRPRQCCGARGVTAVDRGARGQQRADRGEVVPGGRRSQRPQPVGVAAVEVRAERQELAQDFLGTQREPMGGQTYRESIWWPCLFGVIWSIIQFSEGWLHHCILPKMGWNKNGWRNGPGTLETKIEKKDTQRWVLHGAIWPQFTISQKVNRGFGSWFPLPTTRCPFFHDY